MILSKLGPHYLVFASTFYANIDTLGSAHKMPSLGDFAAHLTREQTKLAHMGTLKPPRSQALFAKDPNPKVSSGKGKK